MRRFRIALILAIAAALAAALAAGPAQGASRKAGDAMTADELDRDGPRYSASGHDITRLSAEELAERVAKLTPEQARITQRAGTETAFCGTLLDNKKDGVYLCVVCGLPLFDSEHKFDSGTGWPSFHSPHDPEHVGTRTDRGHGMVRTEIFCTRCNAHLGHVFEDGPRPTGRRYCLNSEAMTFVEEGRPLPPEARPVETETAYFAGGCFWGIEDVFEQIPGVLDAVSGYMGGNADEPTYREVCSGDTGHAETVRVTFDPRRVGYRRLVEVFFKNHDPTTLNRQGPDIGTQYRSAIFAADEEQAAEARGVIKALTEAQAFGGRPIVTEVVEDGGAFWEAEAYHQDYHARHGGSCRVNL